MLKSYFYNNYDLQLLTGVSRDDHADAGHHIQVTGVRGEYATRHPYTS